MKNDINSASLLTKQQRECLEVCEFYQAKFPSVSQMSWATFFEEFSFIDSGGTTTTVTTKNNNNNNNNNTEKKKIILIDVRTDKEYQTSTIPGAISLKLFDRDIMPKIINDNNNNNKDSKSARDVLNLKDVKFVTFCTIGYRSGLEAELLMKKYPNFISKENIYHLQGIVPYVTLSLSLSHDNNKSVPGKSTFLDQDNNFIPILVKPNDTITLECGNGNKGPLINTNNNLSQRERTNKIHTFSYQWDYTKGLNNGYYEPVYFSFAQMIYQGLAVQFKPFRNK